MTSQSEAKLHIIKHIIITTYLKIFKAEDIKQPDELGDIAMGSPCGCIERVHEPVEQPVVRVLG